MNRIIALSVVIFLSGCVSNIPANTTENQAPAVPTDGITTVKHLPGTPLEVQKESATRETDTDIFDELFPVIGDAKAGDFAITESGEVFRVFKSFSYEENGIYIWKPEFGAEAMFVNTDTEYPKIVEIVKPTQVQKYHKLSLEFSGI